jgi:hypothetical protein
LKSHTVGSVTFINQGELLLSVNTSVFRRGFRFDNTQMERRLFYAGRVGVYLGSGFIPTLSDWSGILEPIDLGTTGKGKVKRRIQEGRQLGQNF